MTNKKLDMFGNCPECKVSWDGGDIFESFKEQEWTNDMTDEQIWKEIKSSYSEPYKWSKLGGIEDPMIYDGVSWWQCPFCKATWDRWTEELIKEGENDETK